MEQLSISFTLGKPSEAHHANLLHNNRCYLAKNIDPEQSSCNIQYKSQSLTDAYRELFSEALKAYNAAQRVPCRRICDYLSHIMNSKREEAFYEIVVQFGDSQIAAEKPEYFQQLRSLLDEYMKGFSARNPNLHVFNAVMHLDEASPHLHIDFVPFYTKNRQRGLKKGVSLRAALLEQGFTSKHAGENHLTLWEASERSEMESILKRHGIVREDKHAVYAHMTVGEYKSFKDSRCLAQSLRRMRVVSGSEQSPEAVRRLKQELRAAQQKAETLETEKHSPYKCFYYSDEEKLAFVQQHMLQADIPFRETDTGFEAPECFVRQIRDIERSYCAPSVSVRAQLRDDIDRYLYQSGTFDEFLAKLEANGFAVKKGKYLSVRAPYGERFLRLKSLGIYYDEINLRRRLGAKLRFEERLQNEIQQKREAKAPSLCALLETRHYITVFAAGKLPLRRKHRELPFSWINDAELDKLLVLNKQLNAGLTVSDLRRQAEELEQKAREAHDKLTEAEAHLTLGKDLKEKLELLYEGKPSERFTPEQARETVRQYQVINEKNYRNIDDLIAAAEADVQSCSDSHRELRDKLKQVTDTLSIIEQVQSGTYVQHLVQQEQLMRQTEVLGNGYTNAGRTV